ncbi:hypothetical protein HCW_01010 [Helicobacter cetorum MIT 00-7128]|uniref:Uncharacterized protein n=1 Tax=Helicobacter cetorum (strain ATCC BAA-429 / MIT 00-7128) TaxID=182217 RepID=I0EKM6_HELC0|nr:hypothetical protein HCW_01010 [Helicobacter cetorum MIT 00-7128]
MGRFLNKALCFHKKLSFFSFSITCLVALILASLYSAMAFMNFVFSKKFFQIIFLFLAKFSKFIL